MNPGGSELEGGWQPTQLLKSIMDMAANSIGVARPLTGVHDQDRHKEITSDSPPCGSNSLPIYHYHGLAATQTQSPRNDETFESNESSQKENISASRVNGNDTDPTGAQTPPNLPTIRVPPADQAMPRPSRVTKTKSTTNDPISFKSPYTTTEPNKATAPPLPSTRATTYPIFHTTFTPPVELEQFSQDSFAGPISQDPEQQFLAASKQFEIPLSDLGRVVASPDHTTGPTGRTRSAGVMSSYSGVNHNARRSSLQPSGRILVAATPSNSDGSQSQPSQPFDDFQGHGQKDDYGERAITGGGNDFASQRSTQGYESSFPSSSYERLLNGERDPDLDVAQLQPTQPCTQQDTDMCDVHDETQSESDAQTRTIGTDATRDDVACTDTTSTTNPHPRSLLSMVHPKNQWRYQQFQDAISGLPQYGDKNPPVHRQSPHAATPLQETQPALEEELPRRQFPKPTRSTAPSTSNTTGRTPTLLLENDDQMDIVPDSEPLRGNSTSRARTASRSPTKKMVRLNSDSSDADPNSGEIFSDSMLVDEHEGGVSKDHHGKEFAKPSMSGKRREVEDEDDDDVPLAITSNRGMKTRSVRHPDKNQDPLHSKKGKAPSQAGLSKQEKAATKPLSTTAVMDQGKKPSDLAKKGVSRLSDTNAIPSSIPGEEGQALSSGRRLRVNTKAGEGAAKSTIPPRGGANKLSKSKMVEARNGSAPKEHTQSEDEDELRMREAGVKEEDETEPADDEYMEADHPVAGPSTRKRKRGAPATKSTTARSKIKALTKTTKHPSVTPITRQTKRLRTASVNRGGSTMPTRVFALWRQDGHFYSGDVQAHEGGTRYLISFDDGTESRVTIDQMRLCKLRVGDIVLLPKSTRSCKVVDVAKFDSEQLVSISVDDEIEELRISDIVIAPKTIAYAWKDRTLTSDSIVTAKPTKLSPTPSTIASGPSARSNRRKILAKTGLVITLSSSNNQWEKDKENIMAAVKNTGGTVIDDWASIFRMEGRHSHLNNRWVIEKSDVKWIGRDDIERVFLLADNANQKPKFLIALALGIPCVCVSWLHDSVSVGEDKEWQAYLLPQGYSDALHARPSQQIDMDWGNSVHQLINIMDTSVACKLFDDKSILCIGPEMVPQPRGKKLAGTDEKAQEAHNAVVRIILSMGARRVEAVSELRYASAPVSEFDLVVIKEVHHYDPALDNGSTVHWSWVKDCLIASRQLPLPVWGLTNSQDA